MTLKTFPHSEQLTELVDDRPAEQVFRVHPAIFSDPDIFELEITHIFERTWSFVALESQLAKPHDFITGRIGRTPVLLTRDGDGRLHGFLNICRHKGALLCRSDSGNRRSHVCVYHGWSFDSTGRNIYVRDIETGFYGEGFRHEDHDLVALARVESYRGLVFASLNPNVPPLEEFLGEMRPIIDLAMEQGPHGMEAVPGRMRYTFQGNWKLQMDNGQDFYHLGSTHTSFLRVLQRRSEGAGHKEGHQYDWKKRMAQQAGMFQFEHGHNAVWINQPEPANRPIYPFIDEIRSRVGEEKASWMLRNRNCLVFPNMQIAEATSLLVRVFHPVAVDRTEMRVFCLAPIGEPPEQRARRIRQFEDFFNPAGLATPDDNVVYQECQQGAGASGTPWLQGYFRGLGAMQPGANEAARSLGMAPEASLQGHFDIQNETCFHPPYREWLRLMQAGMNGQEAYQ